MADTPTTVAVIATSLSTVVLTIGRLLKSRETAHGSGAIIKRLSSLEREFRDLKTTVGELQEHKAAHNPARRPVKKEDV